jgi:hypothetical protein
MKRPHVFGLFVTVAFFVMIMGLAFAEGGKAQGQPFQYLQQQIDELKAQIAVQPNIQGCWAVSFIVTQTGGSAPTPNGLPAPYYPPFYWNTGAKRWNQAYMMVDFQSGTQIKGTYYSWMGSKFFGFPFEGCVNGNSFQFYTSTTESPFNGREEQRYLNGILTKDSEGKIVIHGMGLTSRDMATGAAEYHSWNNLVWSFTVEPYEGSCDVLPAPGPNDQSYGLAPPYYGWYMP